MILFLILFAICFWKGVLLVWNFLEVLELLPSLAFVEYCATAITAYGVSLLVSMLIKGGNFD